VRGSSSARKWALGFVAYLAAMPVGALVMGALVYLAGHALPPIGSSFTGLVAAAAALTATGLLPVRFPSSKWQVPREWARLGWVAFTASFGAILGAGVLTRIASPGFYVVLAWGLSAPDWGAIWPAFLAFGLARAAPSVAIALGVLRVRNRPHRMFVWSNQMARASFAVQLMLLPVIAATFL